MDPRPVSDIPSALTCRDDLEARLAGRRIAVFLDYDGTLTPIAERPELAVLSDHARDVVRTLAARVPVAVISGRDRADVERLVGLDHLVYAGSHGFDIRVPGGTIAPPSVCRDVTPLLDHAEAMLRPRLDAVPGAQIERKRFTIAVHYRRVAPEQAGRVHDAVAAVVAALPALKAKPGKMVHELQPAIDWHKGEAVLWLLRALGLDGAEVLPLFLGDDVTDEDAFAALRGRGLGIIVADPAVDPARRSVADYRLDDVDQAVALLEDLADTYTSTNSPLSASHSSEPDSRSK